jgi:ABC-type lipoprotein release transport system permease subunit
MGQTYRLEESSGKLAEPVSIVGVMKDAKYGTLRENTLPTAFVPASQQEKPRTFITYELRTAAAPLTLKPFVTEAAAGIDKNISIEFNTLATQVDDSLIQERLVALLSGFFGALALLLATVGLYGVMSYMVARRRNEIGIRMALGAERRSVLALILREVALLIGAGVIAGGAAAFATTRLVTKMLFGLKPNDATTMLLAAAILIAVAAVAGYVPARRAASLDPMAALREE